MKMTSLLPLLSVIALSGSVFAQDADEKKEPVTISQALKIGEERLTEYTGLSEVGQDEAAELYATAKRITTEQALREKNLQLVIDLDGWRTIIAQCRRTCMSLGFITNNGGTMSGHQARRDSVAGEDFLSEMSTSLPFPDGKGDPRAPEVIDHTIGLIKKLKADRNQKSELTERVKSAIEDWTRLKDRIASLRAVDAATPLASAPTPSRRGRP
jgi:hypothetical protein